MRHTTAVTKTNIRLSLWWRGGGGGGVLCMKEREREKKNIGLFIVFLLFLKCICKV